MNSLMDLKENFPDVKIHQVTLNTERLFHIEQTMGNTLFALSFIIEYV